MISCQELRLWDRQEPGFGIAKSPVLEQPRARFWDLARKEETEKPLRQLYAPEIGSRP